MNTTATAPKLSAADRRYTAINRILEVTYSVGVVDETVDSFSLVTAEMADHFATRIREELAGLGRTDRWKAAVEGWARLVESGPAELAKGGYATDEEALTKRLSWALNQGGIYTAYAAD